MNGPLVAEMFNILGFSSSPSALHQNNMGAVLDRNGNKVIKSQGDDVTKSGAEVDLDAECGTSSEDFSTKSEIQVGPIMLHLSNIITPVKTFVSLFVCNKFLQTQYNNRKIKVPQNNTRKK